MLIILSSSINTKGNTEKNMKNFKSTQSFKDLKFFPGGEQQYNEILAKGKKEYQNSNINKDNSQWTRKSLDNEKMKVLPLFNTKFYKRRIKFFSTLKDNYQPYSLKNEIFFLKYTY